MYIYADTLDDLLRKVFPALEKAGEDVSPTKGDNSELFGIIVEIKKPLCRVSRTEMKGRFFSAIGEFFWYLAGSNDLDFIKYYIPKRDAYLPEKNNDKLVWGAYGPRLFKMHGSIDQLSSVANLLKKKPTSRRAVIQLFDANDLMGEHADIPCTCTLQFLVRKSGLDLFVCMRSNDAYKGLPHDVFAFTMLQELVARSLGVPIGRYKHAAGSLHLYREDMKNAASFLAEAWHLKTSMPPMPSGDQWPAAREACVLEERIRMGEDVNVFDLTLDPYWADIVRMLKIFALTRGTPSPESNERVKNIAKAMSNGYFRPYIHDRLSRNTF